MHDIAKRPASKFRKRPDWGLRTQLEREARIKREEEKKRQQEIQEREHLMRRGTQLFAGMHFLLDFYEIANIELLNNPLSVTDVLCQAAEAGGATILGPDFHRFSNGGVTGVLLLVESHITIHTRPERGSALVDMFMGGNTMPERSVLVLKKYFGNCLEMSCKKRGRRLGLFI